MTDEASTSTTEQHAAPIRDHYAPHVREEMALSSDGDDPAWEQNTPIDKFREKFNFLSTNTRTQEDIDTLASLSENIATAEDCQKLLNAVGKLLQGTTDSPDAPTPRLMQNAKGSQRAVAIRFRAQGSRLLRRPPEGTFCRPDIVAYNPEEAPVSASTRNNTQEYVRTDDLTWAQVEVTAKYLSAQDTPETSLAKAITYTCYHLLSRPDRVIVPGFYFGPEGFSLIFTGASGTCHTELEWTNRDHLQLLCDFVERIFKPSPQMIDPHIVRNTDDTFDVTLKTKTYPRCKILSLGRALGRRTTIFTTGDPDAPIIKEQYLTSPSPEARILEEVGGVPDVFGLLDHEEYRTGELVVGCTIGKKPRFKIRLALRDKGTSIKESQTPEEFLILMYDLLEVAECLHEKDVLHRDWSPNNVLFREPRHKGTARLDLLFGRTFAGPESRSSRHGVVINRLSNTRDSLS